MRNFLNALRLEFAQLPKLFYFLSGLAILLCLMGYYLEFLVLNFDGEVREVSANHKILGYGAIIGFTSLISFVVSAIIGGRFLKRLYQKAPILESFYNTPLSPGERVGFVGFLLLIVAPFLALAPILLVLAIVCGLSPFGIIAPGFGELFPDVFAGILGYYATTLLWVYPTIAASKRDGLIIFGLFVLAALTVTVFGELISPENIRIPAAVLGEADVVGLLEQTSNFSEAPYISVAYRQSPSIILSVLVVLLTTAAVALGIVNKQA